MKTAERTHSPGTSAAEVVLAVRELTAGYTAEVDILHEVDLELRDGEIVTIIGPNGAGKSTLIKAIFGLAMVRSGSVLLHGDEITGMRPSALVRRGVAYVPQRDNVFPTLSVRENLEMGNLGRKHGLTERIDRMYGMFPRLGERSRQAAGTLSGGERQMVAMARALMSQPEVLLLDEPSAGLAPSIVREVFDDITTINASGVSILLVEQNARRALAMSDRGYVLDLGRNAHTGSGPALLDDPKVAELYLGGAGTEAPAP